MDDEKQFGDISSIMRGPQGPRAWTELCRKIDAWEDPDELENVLLPYVEEHLVDWPEALRQAPSFWIDQLLEGEHVPHFQIVRTLDLRCLNIVLEDAELLAESPEMEHVSHLNLAYNGLQSEGTIALAHAPVVRNLISLDLAGNSIDLAGIVALCSSDNLVNLHHLDLTGNWVDDEGACAIAEAEHFANLETLVLRGNPIHAEGAKALAESSALAESIRKKWRER
ncbi:MAG: hypothetical protein AAGI01_07915 [Myxococcota bacterium]